MSLQSIYQTRGDITNPNLSEVMAKLSVMSPQQLQAFAAAHEDDPIMLSAAQAAHANHEKFAQAKMAQQGGQMPPVNQQVVQNIGPVPRMPQGMPPQGMPPQGMPPQGMPPQASSQLPEQQGIAQLPAPNIQNMAGGGIVAFADGGYTDQEIIDQDTPVTRMASGGTARFADQGIVKMSGPELFNTALDMEGVDDPQARAFLKALHGQESSSKKTEETSNRNAHGAMQILPSTFKQVADPDMDINKPLDNMRAGIRYGLKGFTEAKGNPVLAGAYYYGGPGGMQKAMKGIAVSDPENPNAPTTLGYGKSIAARMNALLPIGTAQATEVPVKAPIAPTPKDLVSQIPGSKVAPPPADQKTRYLTGNEQVIGAGETALQYLTGAAAIPLAGAYTALGQVPNAVSGLFGSGKGADREEMERLYRERAGAMTYQPRTVGGQTVSEGFGRTLEDLKIPAYMARVGIGSPKGPVARPSAEGIAGIARQMEQAAAEKQAAVSTPRLEPPRTEKPKMVVDSEGRAMPEDTRARVGAAFDDQAAAAKAAQDAAAWNKAAQEAKNAPDFSKYAGVMDEGQLEAARARGLSALAAVTPSNVRAQQNAPAPAVIKAGENQFDPYRDMSEGQAGVPPKPSDVIQAAKDATPTKNRKGFDDEDLLTLGLSLMANKSPRFLTALGESGLQTLSAKKEREKRETDLEYKDIMKKYYGAMGEKAGAEAEYIASGEKGRMADRLKAAQLIENDLSAWRKTMEGGMPQPGAEAAKRKDLTNYYFGLFGIDVPSTMASTAGVTIPQGVKVTRG